MVQLSCDPCPIEVCPVGNKLLTWQMTLHHRIAAVALIATALITVENVWT